MIAADSVDTTVVAAFAVGFVSFISPCVLPLVPGYLSTISGVSFADIQAGKGRAKVLGPAILFCLSFTVMFVALGMTATGVGTFFADNRRLLQQIAGVVLIALGALFIATLFVSRLNREWRPEALLSRASTGGPIVAGLAFAVAWLPCTGPTLGAILTAASTEENVGQGGVLLAFYALGLAVPFILCALAFSSVSGFFRFFRDHYTAITVASGVVLVIMGVLLYTNELTRLNSEALALMDDLASTSSAICSYFSACASQERHHRLEEVVAPWRRHQRVEVALVGVGHELVGPDALRALAQPPRAAEHAAVGEIGLERVERMSIFEAWRARRPSSRVTSSGAAS